MTMRKAKYMMYIPLVVIGLVSLVPFLWLVRSSFMDSYEIFEFPLSGCLINYCFLTTQMSFKFWI
ncbi:hypothetical protein [Enterococcus gallinarum]|uniref:Uncharacterized protein n=1 Tax=Enterococcus gallinarum TaxID=1353 RepID=A0A376H5I4_ENTGA|nr:hypothetical protein [Enterococcus gallinarum]STD84890.1 Uncharacterised protein [Enterococcus gallinarum]STD87020.1 Uncharacterised protein [Enterococcus gallinarum]